MLHVDYIDLYMIHSPIESAPLQAAVWAAIHNLIAAGLVRSAGVSNFNPREVMRLMESGAPKPAVLQNKFDIYHRGKQWDSAGGSVLGFCRDHGITMMGYSPLDSFPFVLQVRVDNCCVLRGLSCVLGYWDSINYALHKFSHLVF